MYWNSKIAILVETQMLWWTRTGSKGRTISLFYLYLFIKFFLFLVWFIKHANVFCWKN